MTTTRRFAASYIVAIGASGGQGLRDIEQVLTGLPARLDAVVMVVLHRPADKISHLRSVLSRKTALPVVIADNGVALIPGSCYIGEPDAHLELAAAYLGHLVPDNGFTYRNRTVDLLFHSVAKHAGSRFIGVVLSGALDDGTRGLTAIKEAGGISMVLTPHPQGAPGMPENAISYDGPIDVIGSPERITAEIIGRVGLV